MPKRFKGVVRSSARQAQQQQQQHRHKGLNRRQLTHLAEYGHAGGIPLDDDDGDELAHEDERRFVKVIDATKTESKRAPPRRQRGPSPANTAPAVAVDDEPADGEDDAWERPSAFDQLLQLIGPKSESSVATKRARPTDFEDETNDNPEPSMQPRRKRVDRVTGPLDAVDESSKDDEDDGDDNDNDVDIGNNSDDGSAEADIDAEAGDDEITDWFDAHFGDDAADEIQTAAELQCSDGFKWSTRMHSSNTLGQVTVYDTIEMEDAVDAENDEMVPAPDNLLLFGIKQRLHAPWRRLNKDIVEKTTFDFTPLQTALLGYMSEYKDVYFTQCSPTTDRAIQHVIALHCMNHAMKTRDRVLKSTAKLKQQNNAQEIRDQGFTRPKVLILMPFRYQALQTIQCLLALAPVTDADTSFTIENKKRFTDEYDVPEEEKLEQAEARKDPSTKRKPADFERIFDGNTDDCFRIGLKITRKSFKLYSDFYSSDILIASPLGLRLIIGTEGDKKRDFDFLSSIEVLVVGNAHVLGMQNWDHVLSVFENANLIPTDAHGCDFGRVRQWSLDGQAKYTRQTIILSDYSFPEANALFHRHCSNYSGKIKSMAVSVHGTISSVVRQLQHIFHRIPAVDPSQSEDARFEYFSTKIFPALRSSTMSKHTCIFVPTYFEYVRLRNLMRSIEVSFAGISEYTTDSNVARARSRFMNGQRDLLLYSERFHFYRRYRLRGIRHLIFYSLPTNALFFPEMLNMLEGDGDLSCTVLFSRFDALRLERVVGSQRALHMVASDKPLFMFCS